jgi:hypothetical protein
MPVLAQALPGLTLNYMFRQIGKKIVRDSLGLDWFAVLFCGGYRRSPVFLSDLGPPFC